MLQSNKEEIKIEPEHEALAFLLELTTREIE